MKIFDRMSIEKKQLSKNNVYQQNEKDILHLKEGIEITGNVWNKYVEHLEKLIASNKITDKAALKIQEELDPLKKWWDEFKAAWKLPQPKTYDQKGHDQQDNSLNNQILQTKKLEDFTRNLAELHRLVQDTVYPGWLDRLHQFIQTNLLKLYNCLFAGYSGNISCENVYLVNDHYRPNKYNYFICQEKLSNNTALLNKDLNMLENFEKDYKLNACSPKR